jgi:Domain of unknown function (DUF222)
MPAPRPTTNRRLSRFLYRSRGNVTTVGPRRWRTCRGAGGRWAVHHLNVSESMLGISEVYGNVFASTALAFDRRLNELAGTVCEADPRTAAQRSGGRARLRP